VRGAFDHRLRVARSRCAVNRTSVVIS
jgi:hypothetical protein